MSAIYIERLNTCAEQLDRAMRQLDSLADALRYVGNERLAGRLMGLSEQIEGAIKTLVEGREMALMAHVGAVEQGSVNMVNAALAALSK